MQQNDVARIFAGTLAGWSVVTVGQPLDFLKTLYQVRSHHHHHHLPSIRQIYNDIGLRGFYKGASNVYLFAGVITALQFQSFQRVCRKLYDLGLQQNSKPTVSCLLMSGFMSGFICSFIYTPVDYSKIHSQIQTKGTLGSTARMIKLLKQQKLRGLSKLYTGHSISVFKQSISSACYYGGYHVTLTRLFRQERQKASKWAQLISGGIAGVLYQLFSYPFDTIKTNIQSGKKSFGQLIHSKFWNSPNFRNGFKISLLRSFMVDATNFTVYENMQHILYAGYKKIYH